MDLGLSKRRALICGSSQGLGYACAQSLSREGAIVILNGRDEAKLEAAAARLHAETGGEVLFIAADQSDEKGRARLIAGAGDIDILVNNNAGPAPGALVDWDHDALIGAVEMNLIPAVQMMRAFIPGMQARRFGRIVNITSAMVKSPRLFMGLSCAARAGLTAVSKAISREVVIDNVTINNLLPERIDTPRQEFLAQKIMREKGVDRDTARTEISDTIAAKRFGLPHEFGDACAFLCSVQASFISGQNLQVDGGSYEGLV
ncbi:SDR family oxidoreductase [Frigidibacter mobilis]|uniref:Short-chain dehydrogenase/reductase SDR n=1 Tax=Frigidibacter mobilis TaxID=1335048 RepID=A0A159Z6R4_9RHOB|nr:SDR family oxidoreductase [Frigidibacter mobilis]AMY71041.1 short-chain dehydrogenase/reductase SDR [Frigidibacter mobilis]